MKKTIFLVAAIYLLMSSCEIIYAQQATTINATKNGLRRIVIEAFFDSLKFKEPLGLPSYAEDSLRRVGELMQQADTLKWKTSQGVARLLAYPPTDKIILAGDGRVFKPRTIADLGITELAGRRSVPFIWKESITAIDSTRTDIYEVRGVGVIDSVSFIQVGASALTFMVVKDSSGTRRDIFNSNQSVLTTRSSSTSILFPNLQTGFKFFISFRSITGTMTWFKVQIFYHITS